MMFKVGSKVEARMPGTRLYYKAEVMEAKDSSCVIKFDNGSIHVISDMYLRPVTKMTMRSRRGSRSPARTKVTGANNVEKKATSKTGNNEDSVPKPDTRVRVTKSPSRVAKSPSRVTKSPSRVTKSPSRVIKSRLDKSPSRVVKTDISEIKTRSKSRSRRSVSEDVQDDDTIQEQQSEKTLLHISPGTKTINVKDWSDQKKTRASVILCDILHSSRSNSRQSSSSYTNSELEALDQGNLGRESPVFTETDFLNSDIEETSEIKPKMISRVIRRLSRDKSSKTPESDIKLLSNIRKQESTPIKETLNSEVSDLDDDIKAHNEHKGEKISLFTLLKNSLIVRVFNFLFATSLIVSVPLVCLYMYKVCNSKVCTFQKPRWDYLNDFKAYYSLKSSYIYLIFFWATTLTSVIPIYGTTAYGFPNKDGILKYKFNGFFAIVVLMTSITLLHFYKIPVLNYVREQDFKLLVSSISCAFLMSFGLFLRSYFVPVASLNLRGYTGSLFLDFWFGRELNPRIFSVFDIKIIHHRMSILGTIVLLLSYVYGDIEKLFLNLYVDSKSNLDYNSTLIAIVALNIFFHLDLLLHEKQLVATLEVQHDGTGFMVLLKDSLYPFLTAFCAKYIMVQNIRLPLVHLLGIAALFVIGYTLLRYSNNMKYAIRMNPADSRFDYSDFYITYSGKKLLLTKTWGFVRHPNYLGHILILIALSIPLFFNISISPLSFIPLIDSILFLMHRAVRDNRLCEKKHSSSWMRYCGVVKYKVIPYIF